LEKKDGPIGICTRYIMRLFATMLKHPPHRKISILDTMYYDTFYDNFIDPKLQDPKVLHENLVFVLTQGSQPTS
jgi:hypothetical protein